MSTAAFQKGQGPENGTTDDEFKFEFVKRLEKPRTEQLSNATSTRSSAHSARPSAGLAASLAAKSFSAKGRFRNGPSAQGTLLRLPASSPEARTAGRIRGLTPDGSRVFSTKVHETEDRGMWTRPQSKVDGALPVASALQLTNCSPQLAAEGQEIWKTLSRSGACSEMAPADALREMVHNEKFAMALPCLQKQGENTWETAMTGAFSRLFCFAQSQMFAIREGLAALRCNREAVECLQKEMAHALEVLSSAQKSSSSNSRGSRDVCRLQDARCCVQACRLALKDKERATRDLAKGVQQARRNLDGLLGTALGRHWDGSLSEGAALNSETLKSHPLTSGEEPPHQLFADLPPDAFPQNPKQLVDRAVRQRLEAEAGTVQKKVQEELEKQVKTDFLQKYDNEIKSAAVANPAADPAAAAATAAAEAAKAADAKANFNQMVRDILNTIPSTTTLEKESGKKAALYLILKLSVHSPDRFALSQSQLAAGAAAGAARPVAGGLNQVGQALLDLPAYGKSPGDLGPGPFPPTVCGYLPNLFRTLLCCKLAQNEKTFFLAARDLLLRQMAEDLRKEKEAAACRLQEDPFFLRCSCAGKNRTDVRRVLATEDVRSTLGALLVPSRAQGGDLTSKFTGRAVELWNLVRCGCGAHRCWQEEQVREAERLSRMVKDPAQYFSLSEERVFRFIREEFFRDFTPEESGSIGPFPAYLAARVLMDRSHGGGGARKGEGEKEDVGKEGFFLDFLGAVQEAMRIQRDAASTCRRQRGNFSSSGGSGGRSSSGSGSSSWSGSGRQKREEESKEEEEEEEGKWSMRLPPAGTIFAECILRCKSRMNGDRVAGFFAKDRAAANAAERGGALWTNRRCSSAAACPLPAMCEKGLALLEDVYCDREFGALALIAGFCNDMGYVVGQEAFGAAAMGSVDSTFLELRGKALEIDTSSNLQEDFKTVDPDASEGLKNIVLVGNTVYTKGSPVTPSDDPVEPEVTENKNNLEHLYLLAASALMGKDLTKPEQINNNKKLLFSKLDSEKSKDKAREKVFNLIRALGFLFSENYPQKSKPADEENKAWTWIKDNGENVLDLMRRTNFKTAGAEGEFKPASVQAVIFKLQSLDTDIQDQTAKNSYLENPTVTETPLLKIESTESKTMTDADLASVQPSNQKFQVLPILNDVQKKALKKVSPSISLTLSEANKDDFKQTKVELESKIQNSKDASKDSDVTNDDKKSKEALDEALSVSVEVSDYNANITFLTDAKIMNPVNVLDTYKIQDAEIKKLEQAIEELSNASNAASVASTAVTSAAAAAPPKAKAPGAAAKAPTPEATKAFEEYLSKKITDLVQKVTEILTLKTEAQTKKKLQTIMSETDAKVLMYASNLQQNSLSTQLQKMGLQPFVKHSDSEVQAKLQSVTPPPASSNWMRPLIDPTAVPPSQMLQIGQEATMQFVRDDCIKDGYSKLSLGRRSETDFIRSALLKRIQEAAFVKESTAPALAPKTTTIKLEPTTFLGPRDYALFSSVSMDSFAMKGISFQDVAGGKPCFPGTESFAEATGTSTFAEIGTAQSFQQFAKNKDRQNPTDFWQKQLEHLRTFCQEKDENPENLDKQSRTILQQSAVAFALFSLLKPQAELQGVLDTEVQRGDFQKFLVELVERISPASVPTAPTPSPSPPNPDYDVIELIFHTLEHQIVHSAGSGREPEGNSKELLTDAQKAESSRNLSKQLHFNTTNVLKRENAYAIEKELCGNSSSASSNLNLLRQQQQQPQLSLAELTGSAGAVAAPTFPSFDTVKKIVRDILNQEESFELMADLLQLKFQDFFSAQDVAAGPASSRDKAKTERKTNGEKYFRAKALCSDGTMTPDFGLSQEGIWNFTASLLHFVRVWFAPMLRTVRQKKLSAKLDLIHEPNTAWKWRRVDSATERSLFYLSRVLCNRNLEACQERAELSVPISTSSCRPAPCSPTSKLNDSQLNRKRLEDLQVRKTLQFASKCLFSQLGEMDQWDRLSKMLQEMVLSVACR